SPWLMDNVRALGRSMTSPNGAKAAAVSGAGTRSTTESVTVSALRRTPEHPKAADAAVGKDVEPHAVDDAGVGESVEHVVGVGAEMLLAEHGGPVQTVRGDGHGVGSRHQGCLHAGAVGVVALEVGGVDLDALDGAGPAELHDDPVEARLAPPSRFPAVAHVAAASR